jgi:hypothetical protein
MDTTAANYHGHNTSELVSGQFYGSTPNSASEAAGKFEFQENVTGGDGRHTHGIIGSFGVKQ